MKKQILTLLGIALLLLTSLTSSAQTAGTMTFTFTTPKHTSGTYETDARYVLAVWIESCATCGAGTTVGTSAFVRTKLRYWGGNTTDHLPTWNTKSAASITNATTGATSTLFGARTVTWDGTNAAGTTQTTDGNYRVCVQETWGHNGSTVTRYFPFVKGTAAYTNTADVANDANFTNISLTWAPSAAATENFAQKAQATVYPNPSTGVYTIDFTTEVKNIKVTNILGEEVYNQNIDAKTSETKKQVDLSAFTNGVYIISVANDAGSSSYKVVLDK